MALTADEIAARQHYLGGSDIPALLGVDKYRTIVDLWLEKTGRVEPTPVDNPAADLGNRVEPVLVQWAADLLDLGDLVRFNVRATDGHLSSQADGILDLASGPEVIEAKSHGLFNPRFDTSEWGEDGTDHVPFRTIAQVVFAMHLHQANEGYVSALLGGGMGHRLYHLHKSQALADEIVGLANRFWTEHVQADVRPEGQPSLDTVQNLRREPMKVTTLPEDLGHRWSALKEQESLIAAALKDLRITVLDHMGDAEIGDTGWGTFTYKASKNGRRTFRYKELT